MRACFLVTCAVVFIAAFLFSSDLAPAQQPGATAGSAAANSEKQAGQLEQRVGQLEQQLDQVRNNINGVMDGVRKHNDDFLEYTVTFKILAWAAGLAGTVIALLMGWWQIRQIRKEPMHDRMLEKGEKTISLVNEILDLAKTSTKNAMESAERRIGKELKDLEEEVNFLMTFANRDNLDVVVHRDKNDALKNLFNEFTLLDFSNRNLDRPLELTPACLFLQALKYSQEHRFDDAIKHWRKIYDTPGASPGLIIRSRYWVGHEQNNLGRFEEAVGSFEEAVASAKERGVSPERAFELERLSIEAKLFQLSGEGAEGLIPNIDHLVQECETNNLDTVTVTTLRTKGDILYTSSLYAFNNGDKEKAKEYMRKARELWKPLAHRGIDFAEREYAFACIALQENLDEALQLLENNVRDETKNLYTNSIRHRDKAYYAMIQLMVAKAQGAEERAQNMDTRANFHVGEMHDLENPYSPLRKRFVLRREFQRDVRRISEKGLPVLN